MNVYKQYERYHRQMILQGFGEAGQQKLLAAKVLVIGAGGLGCPALQYLTAAGAGTIGIADDDTVALSNLHRQVLFTVHDIGLSKAERAKEVLQQLNPDIKIISFNQRLRVENALDIIREFDIIIDGTDNFSTRYMINDACVLLGKPLVYAAISQYEGQVAVFNCNLNNEPAVNYRDLFPEPPKDNEVLNCAEAGVLGVLPGIIGTMQAGEAIKLITGIGTPMVNTLWTFNALSNQVYELKLSATAKSTSLIPADAFSFQQMNYEWLCAVPPAPFEIDSNKFDELLEKGNIDIIDVRELHETPCVNEFHHKRIPLQQIEKCVPDIQSDSVVIFCQSGKRSKQAAIILSGIFGKNKKVYSLKGGIVYWKNQHTV